MRLTVPPLIASIHPLADNPVGFFPRVSAICLPAQHPSPPPTDCALSFCLLRRSCAPPADAAAPVLFSYFAEKSVFKFQQFNILSPQIVAGKDYSPAHSNKLLIACRCRLATPCHCRYV